MLRVLKILCGIAVAVFALSASAFLILALLVEVGDPATARWRETLWLSAIVSGFAAGVLGWMSVDCMREAFLDRIEETIDEIGSSTWKSSFSGRSSACR